MFKEHAFHRGTSKDFNAVSIEGVFLGWCFDTTRTVGYVKTDERVTRATTIAKLPTTETPEDEQEVPEGWRRLKDPDERVYYENLKGERQWHYPMIMEAEKTVEDKDKEEPQPKRRLRGKQPLTKENQKRVFLTEEDWPPGQTTESSDDEWKRDRRLRFKPTTKRDRTKKVTFCEGDEDSDDGPPVLVSESESSGEERDKLRMKRIKEKIKNETESESEEEQDETQEEKEKETDLVNAIRSLLADRTKSRTFPFQEVEEEKPTLIQEYLRKSTKTEGEIRVLGERGEEPGEEVSSESEKDQDPVLREMRNRIRETFADVLTVMEKENEEKRASASLRPPGWSAFQVQRGAAKKAKMALKRLELRKLKNKTDAAMKEGLIEEQVLREEEEEELQETVDEVSGVNRLVETKEVRQELGLWIEAITGEVNSLV